MAQSHKSLDSITIEDIAALGIASEVAQHLHLKLNEIVGKYGAASPRTWQHISRDLLNPDLPFPLHQMMYYGCYKDFGTDPPAWLPELENAKATNVGQLLERRGKEFLGSKYEDPILSFSNFQEFSVSSPEVYWKTVLDEMNISFSTPPECILRENSSLPGGHWLPGAYVNPAKNCLTLNKKRTLDNIAVLWRDEGDPQLILQKMTVKELRSRVCCICS